MKKAIFGASLITLAILSQSSEVMASEAYDLYFTNTSSSAIYVKAMSSTCMSQRGNDLYIVPSGSTSEKVVLIDSNNIDKDCVNASKEVHWAVAHSKEGANVANLEFEHSKNDGWRTQMVFSGGASGSATCGGYKCSNMGTPGINLKQPSPIMVTINN